MKNTFRNIFLLTLFFHLAVFLYARDIKIIVNDDDLHLPLEEPLSVSEAEIFLIAARTDL